MGWKMEKICGLPSFRNKINLFTLDVIMSQIYALIGISGSGKTTMARTMVRYMNAIIIGRDPLRELLFGYTPETISAYYDLPDFSAKEAIVSKFQDSLINTAIQKGQDIILDNTHLKLSYLNDLKKYGVPIKYVLVDVNLFDAIERDRSRARSVGAGVIDKQYSHLKQLKKIFDFADYVPAVVEPIVQSGHGPSAVIFDIDSTLALKTDRSPYDYSRVIEDRVNPPVLDMYFAFKERGFKIIICSGRDEVCRPDTERWLKKYDIEYEKLYMRENKDQRKDYVIKEEFWGDILKKYFIVAMVDDRRQVIDHARKLGFTVFDVAGNVF